MSIFPSGKIVPEWECQFFLKEKSFLNGMGPNGMGPNGTGPNRNVNLVISSYYYRIIMYNNKMARRRSFIKRTNKKNRTRNRTNKKNRTRNRINKKNRTKRINQKGGAFTLTSTQTQTLNRHTKPVNSVAFHPTAPLLATGSDDMTAKLWRFSPDGSTATCVATLEGHSNCVRSVAFHPTAPPFGDRLQRQHREIVAAVLRQLVGDLCGNSDGAQVRCLVCGVSPNGAPFGNRLQRQHREIVALFTRRLDGNLCGNSGGARRKC